MGCGTSSSDVAQTSAQIVTPLPILKSSETNHSSGLVTISKVAAQTNNMNVVISCHIDQQNLAENLRKLLVDERFPCYIINEKEPQALSIRANLIRWCDIFVVIVTRSYQRTFFCMETINYAKDLKKPIVSILAQSNFQPYGALGAISASSIGTFVVNNSSECHVIITRLSNLILSKQSQKKPSKNVKDPSQIRNEQSDVRLVRGQNRSPILICTIEDGIKIGQLIYNELVSKNLSVALEDLSNPNANCSVEHCSVFVPILTRPIESNPLCLAAFDEARRLQKPLVPVIATEQWRPDDWLGLVIAGITFFRIFDKENAYKPFFDSNRMTDLRVEIERSLQSIPNEIEREQAEKQILKMKIEEIKQQLSTWPPPRKVISINPTEDRKPVRVTIEEPNAALRFAHIHHSISRMDMKPPKPFLDEYGLPKRRELDCMISYQWDDQTLVRKVYEDMSMREIHTWFDIWGSMQGNTNDAMALGVECAKVILVFLSKAYVKSANCLLEFRYAIKRGKAFVIIRTEANISLESWMSDAIQGFPQFDVFTYQALEELINNVPKIDVIMQAVRKIAHAQPADPIDDCSPELFELRRLLDDARDALCLERGQARFKKCSRCNQDFDEFTQTGCKKHRAYYMGGTILEGRWVCCRQQAKDSPGCDPCNHTDAKRVFRQDPSYGTWTWEPA